MPKRQASVSALSQTKSYECKHPWPKRCHIQCGDRGVVLSSSGSYRTAFFEAFPSSPKTFIRGEGQTLEDAENAAWAKYKRIKECPGHEFERRERTDGFGFCRHCNLFAKALVSLQKCCKCPSKNVWSKIDDKDFCRRHYLQLSFQDFQKQPLSRSKVLAFSFLQSKAILKILKNTNLPWNKKVEFLDDEILVDRVNRYLFEYERNNPDFQEEISEESFLTHVPTIKELTEQRLVELNINFNSGE